MYFCYWLVFELMSEGFCVVLLQKYPSRQAFVSTLRYAGLYSIMSSGLTTLGFNWYLLGVKQQTQTTIDSIFVGVPCVLYVLLLLFNRWIAGKRSSVRLYAVFALSWRLTTVVALNSDVYSSLLGAGITVYRSILMPLIMYACLVLETYYWRNLAGATVRKLDAIRVAPVPGARKRTLADHARADDDGISLRGVSTRNRSGTDATQATGRSRHFSRAESFIGLLDTQRNGYMDSQDSNGGGGDRPAGSRGSHDGDEDDEAHGVPMTRSSLYSAGPHDTGRRRGETRDSTFRRSSDADSRAGDLDDDADDDDLRVDGRVDTDDGGHDTGADADRSDTDGAEGVNGRRRRGRSIAAAAADAAQSLHGAGHSHAPKRTLVAVAPSGSIKGVADSQHLARSNTAAALVGSLLHRDAQSKQQNDAHHQSIVIIPGNATLRGTALGNQVPVLLPPTPGPQAAGGLLRWVIGSWGAGKSDAVNGDGRLGSGGNGRSIEQIGVLPGVSTLGSNSPVSTGALSVRSVDSYATSLSQNTGASGGGTDHDGAAARSGPFAHSGKLHLQGSDDTGTGSAPLLPSQARDNVDGGSWFGWLFGSRRKVVPHSWADNDAEAGATGGDDGGDGDGADETMDGNDDDQPEESEDEVDDATLLAVASRSKRNSSKGKGGNNVQKPSKAGGQKGSSRRDSDADGNDQYRPATEYFQAAAAAVANQRGAGGASARNGRGRNNKKVDADVAHVQRFEADNSQFLVDFVHLEIGAFMDRGGTSLVHAGRYKGKPVAIKMFQPERIDEHVIAFFHKENAISAAFQHPSIVRYYGLCVSPPHISLVFELCERGSLWNLVDALIDAKEEDEYDKQHGLGIYANGGGSGNRNALEQAANTQRAIYAQKQPMMGSKSNQQLTGGIGNGDSSSNAGSGYGTNSSSTTAGSSIASSQMKQLAEQQRSRYSLSWRRKLRMARDGASALAYLHSFDPPYLHRDVKSQNFLVTRDYHLKLSDFGESRVSERNRGVPMTGEIGTTHWMAPEMLRGDEYSEAVDIYGFGIVLWEIAAERHPYDELPERQIVYAVSVRGYRPPIPPNCPPSYARLMQACWSSDPNKRPAADEVLAALDAMAEDMGV